LAIAKDSRNVPPRSAVETIIPALVGPSAIASHSSALKSAFPVIGTPISRIVAVGVSVVARLSRPLGPQREGRRGANLKTVTEHEPYIDFENLPAPSEGFLVTQFITVRNVAQSRAFYSEVLGGQVVLEENPCMIKLSNSWLIMNPGGGPTPDKPDISVVDYEPDKTISTFMNLRVADVEACYEEWSAKGAEFLTPPIDRGAEIRCYMRDPDGYMIEVGQSTGLLEGRLAKKRPEDLPG
jgi:catechol 2,3-dioxygenase-like lactoylglutathione lyase family enzyme